MLAIHCILLLLASLLGGWFLLSIRLTHTALQTAVSFIAGLMLGISLLHFIPHSVHQNDSVDMTMRWTLAGFLTMFFLQRLFHYHQHDVPEDAGEPAFSSIAVEAMALGKAGNHLPWVGAAFGLTLHSLMDGITLAAVMAASAEGNGELIGIGTVLALILHKPFDAMTLSLIMAKSGCSKFLRQWFNALFALISPIGVLFFYFGARHWADSMELIGTVLPFCAGSFLCIAGTDLLPELQFHSHDRFKLSISLLGGLALAWLIGVFESSGHTHRHHARPAANAPAMTSTQSSGT